MVRYLTSLGVFVVFFGAQLASAAFFYRVNNGQTVEIDEHSICQEVVNSSGNDLFVPTKTSSEWSLFRTNLPGSVTLNACATVPPDAITDLAFQSRTSSSVTASWSAPADNGTPISDYTIEYKETSSGTWLSFSDGVSTLTSATVTGLTASTSYDFRVAALNGAQSGWSNTLTQETAPNDPFFDPTTFSAMNCGGATSSQVVAFMDNTTIQLNGTDLPSMPINAGATAQFTSAQGDILSSDKPFFVAGRLVGVGTGNVNVGNIVWNTPDWSGKDFLTLGSRDPPHIVTVYTFEAATINITRGAVPVVTNDVLGSGVFKTYSLATNGAYTITSTGTITAYQYSERSDATRVVDNMPIIPPDTDIIGIPSRTGQYTTSATSTTGAWYESDGTSNTSITLNYGAFNSYGGNGNNYNSPGARVIANADIIGRSNADADGNDVSVYVPKSFQKRMFAINHLSEWVSFVSTQPAVIQEFQPNGTHNTFTLTRTGTNPNTPYFARRTSATAIEGTVYESNVPFQAYYETDQAAEVSNEREDETLLFGYAGSELPVNFKLKLWLDANDSSTLFQLDNCTSVVSTNGENVGCWKDKSLHGNDVTQTGVNKPTFTDSVTGFGTKPGVDFNGGTNYLNFDESIIDGTEYTILAVIHRDTTASNNFFMGTQSALANRGLHLGFQADGTAEFGQTSNDITTAVSGQAQASVGIFSARLNGTGKQVYFNNVTNTDATATQLGTPGQGVIGRGFDTNGFDGQIAEIIVYSRALSDAELDLMEEYLYEKYFKPSTAGDIRLWLDASDMSRLYTNAGCTTNVTGTGQNVLCWADRSGNIYNAVQSTGTPQYVLDGGANAVHFTNDSLQVAGSPDGAIFDNASSVASMDVFAVMRSTNASENGYVFSHLSGNDFSAQIPNASSNAVFNLDTGASGTISAAWGGNTTNYFLWNLISDNPSTYQGIYRDHTLVTSDSTTSTLSIGTDNFYVGAQNGTTNFQNMRLRSLIIFGAYLSMDQRHMVRAYLENKWGL